jgi:hypothetical protein
MVNFLLIYTVVAIVFILVASYVLDRMENDE